MSTAESTQPNNKAAAVHAPTAAEHDTNKKKDNGIIINNEYADPPSSVNADKEAVIGTADKEENTVQGNEKKTEHAVVETDEVADKEPTEEKEEKKDTEGRQAHEKKTTSAVVETDETANKMSMEEKETEVASPPDVESISEDAPAEIVSDGEAGTSKKRKESAGAADTTALTTTKNTGTNKDKIESPTKKAK